MLSSIFNPQRKRHRLLQKCQAGVLHDWLATPWPEFDRPLRQQNIVALDFETTGLNPKKDEILSIGLIEIEQMCISVSSAYHQLVKPTNLIPRSTAVIHNILDDQARGGGLLEEVIPELLARIRGKLVLAHHAKIEAGFLNQACLKLFNSAIAVPFIDSLRIEQACIDNNKHQFTDFRLDACCQRYNLNALHQHDALNDALSSAQLLLAQYSHHSSRSAFKPRKLIKVMP